MTHDFKTSLALSQSQAEAPWWEPVYRAAFRNFASMVSVRADGWAQRGGIDRVITLKSGKTLTVDEKVRSVHYDDILLERWSDQGKRTPGWIQKDLACDFIAYAFIPSQTCHLLPFPMLRRAWLQNGTQWIAEFKPVIAPNRGYQTESIPVPTARLLAAIMGAMTVSWAGCALQSPTSGGDEAA